MLLVGSPVFRAQPTVSLRIVPAAVVLLWVVWSFGLSGTLAGPRIDLNTRLAIPMNDRIDGAAVGDFDRDGILDIAVVHRYLSQGVEILHGLGAGRFEAWQSITTTSEPTEVVAADLNHDGILDLAMTGSGPAVTVLFGDWYGQFGSPNSFGSTQRSDDLAVADLNGDGDPDIAVTHYYTNTLDIFAGNGAGAFVGPMVITIPAASSSGILARDFNGDGRADLAIGVPSGIVFIAGLGLGGYGTPVSSVIGSGSIDLTSADFDVDGIPDLATTDPNSGSALVLRGTGDGHFTLAQTIPVTPGVTAVASGDLNADGRADLVVIGSDMTIVVLLATGPGQFGAGVPYPAGYLPRTLILADLDQDGRQDLLTGNVLGEDLAILRGDGLGRFGAETSLTFPWPVSDIGAADFDGDGTTDLAVLQGFTPGHVECGQPPYPNLSGPIDCGPQMQVLVLSGTGQASFGPPISAPARCDPSALAIADFNGDGRPDVATANRGARDSFGVCYSASLSVFAGDGHGHLASFIDLVVPNYPNDIVAGDFNEDGVPDVAVAFADPNLVAIYRLAPGPALVLTSSWVPPAVPQFLAAADLTGDGHFDLAVALSNGEVAVLRGNGAGVIAPASVCAAGTEGGTGPVSIGNFDGSGLREIAAIGTNSVRVMQVAGMGAFCSTSYEVPVPAGAQGLGARDLNGDGIDDLLITDGHFRVSVVAGGFIPPWMPDDTYGDSYSEAVTTADFDSDGLPDVAVAVPGYGVVSVVRNITPAAPRLILRLEGSPMTGPPAPAGADSTVSWTGVLGATRYDVVRGSLATLRTGRGDFTSAVHDCLANDLPWTHVVESDVPPVGDGWWFLARPLFPAGPGSYDGEGPGQVGRRDSEIAASPLACP
jgi:hypothetical protein